MQELALVPLLAQPPQPVFAHNCLLAADVAERTHAPCQGDRRVNTEVALGLGAKVPSPHTFLKPEWPARWLPQQKAVILVSTQVHTLSFNCNIFYFNIFWKKSN